MYETQNQYTRGYNEGYAAGVKDSTKKANWVPIDPDQRGYTDTFRCLGCRQITDLNRYVQKCDYEYCPHCGAIMED